MPRRRATLRPRAAGRRGEAAPRENSGSTFARSRKPRVGAVDTPVLAAAVAGSGPGIPAVAERAHELLDMVYRLGYRRGLHRCHPAQAAGIVVGAGFSRISTLVPR